MTTHWNWCEELARDYPRVTVDPNPIYVRDGNCYTSAGVTGGIDLALALVRMFHSEVGKTPARYIEDLRIEAARRQIESTVMTLKEIALSCGFTSAEILRRAFVRRLGVTPTNIETPLGTLAYGNSPRQLAEMVVLLSVIARSYQIGTCIQNLRA